MTARSVLPVAIVAAGCAVFVVYAYPGYMSYDSAWQLREARAGVFSDWHPPVMAELWRWTDRIVAGPLGMLVVQTACFVAGLWTLARRRFAPIAAAAVTAGLLVFPPVSTTLAVIWKDSQMLGFLVAGLALITSASRARRLVGLGVLVLATAMRHNAFTMTIALVIPLFVWTDAVSRVRRYGLAAAAWLAITALAFGANACLTDVPMHPWHGSLAMFDIVGTLALAPPTSDADVRALLDGTVFDDGPDLQARAKDAYSPASGAFRIMQKHFLAQPTTDVQRAAIARAWREEVFAHPGAYLRHRWRAYRELLQLHARDWPRVWVGYDDTSPIQPAPSAVQETMQDAALAIGRSFVMRPWLYLVLALCLAPFAWRARDSLCLALLASGAISELALFFIAPTPDFRYSVWLVFATTLALVFVIAQRASMSTSRAPRSAGGSGSGKLP